MKRPVLLFGALSGLIVTTFMLVTSTACYNNPDFKGNDVIGYSAMLLSLVFVFIGIKQTRDKLNNGFISFGQAFKTGLLISLIASTCYVGVWLIDYYLFIPDFIDKYTLHVLKNLADDGASPAEIASKTKEMAVFKEQYKNPLFVIAVTYFEVLPIGLVVTLISALILKRKNKA
jgi:hypothetical protein